MSPKGSLKLSCPVCRKTVGTADPDFPFCGERCRILDLGKWASGGYVISSPLRDNDTARGEEQGSERPDDE